MVERMFKWLVCARQPLHVNELRDGLAFTLDDLEWDRTKIVTDLNRLVRACSNLVIIDPSTQVVQFAHYTVEQYLLQENSTKFQFTRQEADTMAGEFCLAYLCFANFENRLTNYKENANTDLLRLERLASSKLPLLLVDQPGRTAIKIWSKIRTMGPNGSSMDVNMTQFSIRQRNQDLSQFQILPYVTRNWLYHTASFPTDPAKTNYARREMLFEELIMGDKKLPFNIQPWIPFLPQDKANLIRSLTGWGLMENHPVFILSARQLHSGSSITTPMHKTGWQHFNRDLTTAWELLCNKTNWRYEFSKNNLNIASTKSYALGDPTSTWVLSKLLSACRTGHIKATEACQPIGCIPVVKFCVVVATIYGKQKLLKMLLNMFLSQNAIHGYENPKIELDGLFLNSLEHAVLTNQSEIYRDLLHAGLSVEVFQDDVSFFALFNDAVDTVQPERLSVLLRILKDAPSTSLPFKRASLPVDPFICALSRACGKGHDSITEILLRHLVDSDIGWADMSPLFSAISKSNLTTVQLLLEHGAVTSFTASGYPLTFAARVGDAKIVELLLKHHESTSQYAEGGEVFALVSSNDKQDIPFVGPL